MIDCVVAGYVQVDAVVVVREDRIVENRVQVGEKEVDAIDVVQGGRVIGDCGVI